MSPICESLDEIPGKAHYKSFFAEVPIEPLLDRSSSVRKCLYDPQLNRWFGNVFGQRQLQIEVDGGVARSRELNQLRCFRAGAAHRLGQRLIGRGDVFEQQLGGGLGQRALFGARRLGRARASRAG